MTESVERSTERHHASITAGDAKRYAAERFLRDDYRWALARLLSGEVDVVMTPAFHRKSAPLPVLFAEQIDEDETGLAAELLAIAYACAIGDDSARAKAVALIARLTDEHVQTHLDAAAEE